MPHLFKKFIKIVFFIYFAVYSLIWLFSPIVARYFISDALVPFNIKLSESTSIRYNPFISHLTINDLALSKLDTQEKVAGVDELDIEVRLYEFLFDDLYISEFAITGLYLKIDKSQDKLTIAGFELPNSNKEETDTKAEQEKQAEEPLPYRIKLPELSIDNAVFALSLDGHEHQLVFNQLNLDALTASLDKQKLSLSLDSEVNKAKLTINAKTELEKQQGQLSVELALDKIELAPFKQFLPDAIKELTGQVTYHGKHFITLAKDATKVKIEDLLLQTENIQLIQKDLTINLAKQVIASDLVTVNVMKAGAINIDAAAALTFNQLALAITGETPLNTEVAEFAYQGLHSVIINADTTEVSLPEFSVDMQNIVVKQQLATLALNKKSLTGHNVTLQLMPEQKPEIQGKADLVLDNLKVYTSSVEQILASLEKLTVENIQLLPVQDEMRITLDKLNLQDFFASDNLSDEIPALAKFSSLEINAVQASPSGFAIDTINLNGLVADVQLNPEKVLLNLVDLPISETAAQEEQTSTVAEPVTTQSKTTEHAPTKSFVIAFNQFTVSNKVKVHFLDQSVAPQFEEHIELSELTLGPIDSENGGQDTLFKVLGVIDKYTTIDFSGIAKPFANVPSYQLNGGIKEFDLVAISPYLKQPLGYEISSGHLDLSLKVKVLGEKIDGNTKLLLRSTELVGADQHEVSNIKEVTSMPLNVALGVLKDRKGNVEIKLPLSGKTSDPKFGLSGIMGLFVKQVTVLAAKEYFVSTFVPYANVVSLALVAGDFALKLRFNDLVYPATVVELQPEHQEFLKQFAKLLKDKKDTQVKLCPIATPEDIGKDKTIKIVDPEEIVKLKAIATQRIEIFKHYMVEQEQVPSAQLLLCSPQIASGKEVKSVISFDI